jgi:cytochrome c oxidase assembly protein subunit 15
LSDNHSSTIGTSAWPHRLAVLLVCATFPLLWVGGLVTTTRAGMAVPDWPGTFGYNLFLYPWTTWVSGPWNIFVEHGHRLFATLIGMLTIALLVVAWLREPRTWVRWLTVLALVAVIGQGVLGGMRVLMNEQVLAMIHGCVGPAFFALTMALAVFTSRLWRSDSPPRPDRHAAALQRLSVITTTMIYIQLVSGAYVRHLPEMLGARPSTFSAAVVLHLSIAIIVVAHVAALGWYALRYHRSEPVLYRPAMMLCLLVVAQIVLGAATWVLKYNWPEWFVNTAWAVDFVVEPQSWLTATITTAHVAMGSLILVTAMVVTLRSWRVVRAQPQNMEQLAGRAVGVAL